MLMVNVESQIKYAPAVGASAVAAAWRSILHGYLAAGMPDGLSAAQLEAVLYLVKIDYLLEGPWRPLYEIYGAFPSSRYLRGLEASVLRGEHVVPVAAG